MVVPSTAADTYVKNLVQWLCLIAAPVYDTCSMISQVKRVRCESSGVLVPKDKAIKRFIVRNIVDASAIRDIQDASVLEGESQRTQQPRRADCGH